MGRSYQRRRAWRILILDGSNVFILHEVALNGKLGKLCRETSLTVATRNEPRELQSLGSTSHDVRKRRWICLSLEKCIFFIVQLSRYMPCKINITYSVPVSFITGMQICIRATARIIAFLKSIFLFFKH